MHFSGERLVICGFFFFFSSSQKTQLSNSTDGGANWNLESLPGASVVGPPMNLPGASKVYFSNDGTNAYATSFKTGIWRRGSSEWVWQPTANNE